MRESLPLFLTTLCEQGKALHHSSLRFRRRSLSLRQVLRFGLALAVCLSLVLPAPAQSTSPIAFQLSAQPVATVSDRLFGHLLERASWGEPGPEIALEPGTRKIRPETVALMHRMNVPLMRFPGGTDVDFTHWQDLISNVPNRDVGRPITTGHTGQVITNDFGLDEYFALRDDLSAQRRASGKDKVETLLVANFLDAVAGKVPLNEAAQNAAGLVAYVNAPIGAVLPSGMVNWPAIRAKNGHPDPFGADYLQIGNELWTQKFRDTVREGKAFSTSEEMAQWYITCLQAYIAAIDAVDPNIALIVDGKMGDDIEKTVLADPTIQERIEYLTYHDYAPGPIDDIQREGRAVAQSDLSASDWWQAWVAMPGWYDAETGTNFGQGNDLEFAKSLGYKVAITEWNWNGWGFDELDLDEEIDWQLASGLGTAGYLHGLMRQGNDIALACQSLLVGANWDITSIRVDADGEDPPYFRPQGQITGFYSRHHGSQLLDVSADNVPRYNQPFKVGWSRTPRGDIAKIDLIATADEQAVYIHAINRAQNQTLPIEVNLSKISGLESAATHYLFAARERPSANWIQSLWRRMRSIELPPQAIAQINSQAQPLANQTLTVSLPKQSVSIFEIAKTSAYNPDASS